MGPKGSMLGVRCDGTGVRLPAEDERTAAMKWGRRLCRGHREQKLKIIVVKGTFAPPPPYVGLGYDNEFYQVVPKIEAENKELESKEQISNLESFLELEPTATAATEAVMTEAGERSVVVVGGFGEEIGGVFAGDVEVVG
ncbi:hypothetical protein QYF36_015786 [Acer negundo]|nr:hypothetical protein QYF36_015786 [Acer negundo]